MKITIVGAGPVGLLTACLLAREHQITIIDKRTHNSRDHLLSISEETIRIICEFLSNKMQLQHAERKHDTDTIITDLMELLRSWADQPVNTSIIQDSLLSIVEKLGVRINLGKSIEDASTGNPFGVLGINVESLDTIRNSIIIGADGARSKIRQLAFNDELVDQHTISYMAQLKFTTPGRTRPRSSIATMGHSFLNGITGDDIVTTFESMSRPNETKFRKSGTLHIPIPQSVYTILSAEGRGNYNSSWTPDELARIHDPHVAKLLRIIKRYSFGVTWRGGWVENPKLTVIPLTIYRSARFFTVNQDKLVLLVGDSAQGHVYQRGLNNGWIQAVKLATTLSNINSETICDNLIQYSEYCIKLYEQERDQALQKGRKIHNINTTTSVGSKIVALGLGSILSGLLIKSSIPVLFRNS